MIIARQSTALILMVGPVLDASGVAVADGVVADFKISKNGAAPAALNGSATLTHRNTGHYSLSLTTSDLGTVGLNQIVIDDTVNACPPVAIQVVEEAVYDALFAANATGMLPANVIQLLGTAWLTPATAGTPDVNAKQIGGTAQTAGDLKTLIDGVSTSISNLNNLSALANLYGSPLLEIPDAGEADTLYAFTLVVRDNEGKLVNLDGSPTIAAANAAGTNRSANLSSVSHPATGRYTFTYAVADDAVPESLRITCSGTVSAEGRYVEWVGAVVDYDTLTTLLEVKAKTDLIPAQPATTAQVAGAGQSVEDLINDLIPARFLMTVEGGGPGASVWARDNEGNPISAGGGGATPEQIVAAMDADSTQFQAIVATLEAIKGAGWDTETLKAIFDKPGASLTPEQVADIAAAVLAGINEDGVSVDSLLTAALTQIRGAVEGATVRVVGPLAPDGKRMRLVQGDDYAAGNGRSLTFEIENAPGLVGSKAVLRLNGLAVDACESPEITQATQVIVMGDMLADVTSQLTVSETLQDYQIRFVKGSLLATVIKGKMVVEAQV